jgi:UDP-N-acetylmuramoyl-tripeptide--D-alanyl-D-alanine ligase
MAELGGESINEHKNIVELIKKNTWSKVVLVGGDFLNFEHPFLKFENSMLAKEWWKQQHFENMHALIKGSRNMQMEKILEE